jgi:hypothetical protein
MKIPKDTRSSLWAELESDIQSRGHKKDSKFHLAGDWKKFFRLEGKLSVYIVDGDWVRNNLSVIFGHGGHGLVHEFIPLNEIWVGQHHFVDCVCKKRNARQAMSGAAIESTIVHEIAEYQAMGKGVIYWEAHEIAHQAERAAGFLHDPYDDTKEIVVTK